MFTLIESKKNAKENHLINQNRKKRFHAKCSITKITFLWSTRGKQCIHLFGYNISSIFCFTFHSFLVLTVHMLTGGVRCVETYFLVVFVFVVLLLFLIIKTNFRFDFGSVSLATAHREEIKCCQYYLQTDLPTVLGRIKLRL